ncbi:MAG: glycosyltransferase [Methanosphaera stadtmanae]|nr:glycosyltransferase [Methanosphaera stadtmanae]
MKISVIMPIYNGEKYIESSINSIYNQSFNDIEVICINDGSTDNSLNILKDLKIKYPSLKILNQENRGSGLARNRGIQEASGEYIAFLDCDDEFLDSESLKIMIKAGIKYNADVVSANIMGIDFNDNIVRTYNLPYITEEKIILPEEYGIPYSYYKNLFKREFLLDNKIEFPNLKRGQDPVFFSKILTTVSEIIDVPVDFYGYRYSSNYSLDKIDSYKKQYDYILHFRKCFDILSNSNFNKTLNMYKETFFKYLNFFEDNKKNIQLYNIIYDIFSDNKYNILTKCDSFFDIPSISIIVPVYNVEEYLEDSLNSIFNQSFSNFEVICVNDGSTDSSRDILEKFSKKNNNIKIIDQENRGCGSARNIGLKNASGEYVYFFDPDDILKENALEKLYANAKSNNSDIVLFKYSLLVDDSIEESSNYNIEKIFKNVDFNDFSFKYSAIKHYILNSSFAPWCKFYSRNFLELFDDFNFPENLAFDDVVFHVKTMLRSNKLSFVPEVLYKYRISNPNSVNKKSTNAQDIFWICDIVEVFLRENEFYDEFESEFINFKIYQILYYLISSNSVVYYIMTCKEFDKIETFKDKISSEIIDEYNYVLSSNTYEEYRVFKNAPVIYEDKNNLDEINLIINQLKIENETLKNENKHLIDKISDCEENYDKLISSRSWKLTSPLRKIKNKIIK